MDDGGQTYFCARSARIFSIIHCDDDAQCFKIRKKCNVKSAKKHYLQFQKWQKFNFCTRKSSENCIFGTFKLFSGAESRFCAIYEKANNAFLHSFEIAFFSNFRALGTVIYIPPRSLDRAGLNPETV